MWFGRVCLLSVCFAAFWIVRPTTAASGFEMEMILSHLDSLQAKLENIERQMTTNGNLRDKLADLENKMMAKMGKPYDLKAYDAENEPYKSCKEVPNQVSGVYEMKVGTHNLRVFCEQNAFGGGWVVFQRRHNGSENFDRDWTDYRNGFGSLDGEFWLGLQNLHQLTSAHAYELVVEMKDFDGESAYARYDKFVIGSENDNYSLTLGDYEGTAGNAMEDISGTGFHTKGRENPVLGGFGCDVDSSGAWWHSRCGESNLNGKYKQTSNDWNAMVWYSWKTDWRSLASSTMMIREL